MTATCSAIVRPMTTAMAATCATRYWPATWRDVTFTTPGGCQVQSGVLHDLYTGKTIDFVRGPQTSSAVQIEHVVALEKRLAVGRARDWGHGQALPVRQRHVTICWPLTARRTARKDRRQRPTGCRPTPTFRCEYVARQIGVKDKYDLSVTTKEKQAMLSVLRSCPRSGGTPPSSRTV